MILKVQFFFLLTAALLSQSVSQYYTADSDVYFRKGPSTSYEVLDVIKAGDTIELIEETSTTWARINFNGNEGYSSLRFFNEVAVLEEKEENIALSEAASSEGSTLLNFWFVWSIFGGLISTLLYFGGRGNRNRILSVLLSLFTGFMGLQKFYLGKIFPGLLSLLFFWTFIPLLIGFRDTIKLAFMDEKRFQLKYNKTSKKTQKPELLKKEKDKLIRRRHSTAVSDRSSPLLYNLNNSEGDRSRMVVETKKSLEPIPKNMDKISLDLNERKVQENPTPKSDFSVDTNKAADIKTNQNGNLNLSSTHLSKEKYESHQVGSDTVNKDFDDGVIDIGNEDLDIQIPDSGPPSQQSSAKPTINNVPYWNQFYVYSYEDISRANYAQKRFYNHFRSRMLDGFVTDIDGNTNYAFILYFDFLKEFEKHQDVVKLENQFKILGECCSKTRNYSLHSLLEILRYRNDQYSVNRLEKLQDPYSRYELGFSDYDPYSYRLGRRFKEKLNLTEKEEAWLNKFHNPSNVFNSIEGCCTIIIKLFLNTLTGLEERLKSEGIKLSSEIEFLKDQVKREKSNYQNVYDFNYMEERVQEEIFLTFFRRSENAVRESFYHKRKISEDFSITEKQLNFQFEERLGRKFNEILHLNNNSIPEPDLPTKIALNAQNVNRWKAEFEKISSHLRRKDKAKFVSEVKDLETANQKNPNVENIFFEASKAISKQDKTKALEYYIKYIYYDINSDKIHNRKLTKTVQKSLFNGEEQLKEFEKIIQQLIYDKNLDDALKAVKEFYKPKRRKIILNKKEIEDVKKKHNTTVDILSGYLEDEEKIKEEDSEEVEMSFTNEQGSKDSIFIESLSLSFIQEEVILKIVQNDFAIQQKLVEEIALKNGQLKNQLIDSINEVCSDILDGEFLIEEDEELYIIEESFYEDIIQK